MEPSSGVDWVVLLSILNYALVGCAGVGVTYYYLSLVFERRHNPLLLWVYFFTKHVVDGSLWYAEGVVGLDVPLLGLSKVWLHVTAVTTLFVVLYTFRGDYVQVGLCAVVSDCAAGILITLAQTLGNLWAGMPYDAGFLTLPSLRTLVCSVLTIGLAFLLREPVSWILRYLCRVALRHRLSWSGLVLAFVTYLAAAVGSVASVDVLKSRFSYNMPFMLTILLALFLLLLQRRRDVVRREQVLSECVALARSYDRLVGEQLAVLDRDRAALEGHDFALRRLGDATDDPGLAQCAAGLEHTYRRLSAGNYCAQPALDAVLTSCAARLRERGVDTTFAVAGVPAQMAVPVSTALTMLNLALEAAERSAVSDGAKLELRIRSVGEQLLFRLDVPACWGMLGTRRFLAPYTHDRATIVRERRRGDRTLVLVIAEAQGR